MTHSSPAQQNALMSQPNTTAGVPQLEEIEFRLFIQMSLESHLGEYAYLCERRRVLFKCQERGVDDIMKGIHLHLKWLLTSAGN